MGETLPVTPMPKRCDCCSHHSRALSDAFVNGKGWQRLCARCAEPEAGPPRPYLGPYPVSAYQKPAPALRAVPGEPRR